jgi:predicted RNA-binding Zn ribbon-like protein
MYFAPDTECSLDFAVAMANTVAGATKSGADELSTPDETVAFMHANQFSGRIDGTEAEHIEVREARDELRLIWKLDRDDAVTAINSLLRVARALPQLSRHDEFDWHLHATDPEAPLAERIRVEVALALVDVIRSNQTDRMRQCAAEDCDGVLIDLSRNGSKRFCSVRCGNRMNMVAFRERANVAS